MLKYRVVSDLFHDFKCDQATSEIGKGNVDDLSKLSYLDEEKLIEELCIRYKNGQIYVKQKTKNFRI